MFRPAVKTRWHFLGGFDENGPPLKIFNDHIFELVTGAARHMRFDVALCKNTDTSFFFHVNGRGRHICFWQNSTLSYSLL